MIDLSVVIQMKNEEANVAPLLDGIARACAGVSHEIIVVDDGSDDGTAAEARRMNQTLGNVRLLAHPRSAGQSAAVHSGALAARGRIVCTLDGDGQNPPAEIPKGRKYKEGLREIDLCPLVPGCHRKPIQTYARRAAYRQH